MFRMLNLRLLAVEEEEEEEVGVVFDISLGKGTRE